MATSSSFILQLADTLKKAGQQLSAQELKTDAERTHTNGEVSEAKRERDDCKRDRDDARRELEDTRRQLDAAIKRGHEAQLERETWKQEYKSCKVQLDTTLSQLEEMQKSNLDLKEELRHLKEQADHWQEQYLRMEHDAGSYHKHYLRADKERGLLSDKITALVKDQNILNRAALQAASSPHTPYNLAKTFVDSAPSSTTTKRGSAPFANGYKSEGDSPSESISASKSRGAASRSVNNKHPQKPRPPARSEHSKADARNPQTRPTKRQKLEGSPPFEARSSVLVRRVSTTVPITTKEEEEDPSLFTPTPAGPSPSRPNRLTAVNPRKRNQAQYEGEDEYEQSEEEDSEVEEEVDELEENGEGDRRRRERQGRSHRRNASRASTGAYVDDSGDSMDELLIGNQESVSVVTKRRPSMSSRPSNNTKVVPEAPPKTPRAKIVRRR